MHIFISTGEISGSNRASSLIKELRKKNSKIKISGIGTSEMADAGCEIWADISHTASVGYFEQLIQKIPVRILIKKIKKRVIREKPDLIILIDSPGFNIKLAKEVSSLGIKTIYYIPPQDFLWNRTGNAQKIIKHCDMVINIFGKGYEAYKKLGAKCHFVGHPILDTVKTGFDEAEILKKLKIKRNKKIVGLFLGNRRQEIKKIAPVILKGAEELSKQIKGIHYVAPIASAHFKKTIKKIIEKHELNINIIDGKDSLKLMSIADIIITKAGTTTLEAGILKCPMIVAYRLNPITYFIATRIIRIQDKIKFISLPNLYTNTEIIPELIQHDLTPENIAEHATRILKNSDKIIKQLGNLRKQMGKPGASRRAAEKILDFVKNN